MSFDLDLDKHISVACDELIARVSLLFIHRESEEKYKEEFFQQHQKRFPVLIIYFIFLLF